MDRWTIKELNEISNKQLILRLINERRNTTTNMYAPLSRRLNELSGWVERNVPDTDNNWGELPKKASYKVGGKKATKPVDYTRDYTLTRPKL